jgi:hypothetical protein
MRMRLSNSLLILATAVCSGCATLEPYEPALVLEAVGPSTWSKPLSDESGTLIVVSALVAQDPIDPSMKWRSEYQIYLADGEFLGKVPNRDRNDVRLPTPTQLPAGEYRIRARAENYGFVTLPVIIAPGRVTVVDLTDEVSWPDRTALLKTNPVRLPGGEIVGWPETLVLNR